MIPLNLSKNKIHLWLVRIGLMQIWFFFFNVDGDGDGDLVSEWDWVNCLGVEIGDREGNVGWRGVLGCLFGVSFGCWRGGIIWAGRWGGGSVFFSGSGRLDCDFSASRWGAGCWGLEKLRFLLFWFGGVGFQLFFLPLLLHVPAVSPPF